jgi:hypothetical protein
MIMSELLHLFSFQTPKVDATITDLPKKQIHPHLIIVYIRLYLYDYWAFEMIKGVKN